jgi:hypothetical protein
VHVRQRPRTGQLSLFRNDLEILATAAITAGVGILLLTGSVMPASGLPLELQAPFELRRPMHTSRPASRHRVAPTRKEKSVARTDDDAELRAKAKEPFNIIISTNKQQLTLYSGETPVAHTRVSTGTASHPTPHGVFSIIQKSRWHRSNIYDNAPMYYMQRITWSGVAMHQGVVPNHPASHGCIRLPEAFAKRLWGLTKGGERVIVARGEVAPVAISHPGLFKFVPKREPEVPDQREIAKPEGLTTDGVKAAYNAPTDKPSDMAVNPIATDVPRPTDPALDAVAKPKPLKPGPIAVFVSRKEGKVFVRKGFVPIFDAPVTFERPDQPIGTHVFTALALKEDNTTMRWMVVSLPTTIDPPRIKKASKDKKAASVPASVPVTETAAGALDRVTIPQDALDRISELMLPGSSLVISDKGLGPETGKGTDFIVLTR